MLTRASVAIGLIILVGASFAVGCSQMATSPTVPTAATSVQPSGGATGTLRPQTLFDSSLEGTAYRFDGVSGTSLTFSNQTAGSLTFAYDSDTKFRRAVLQSWMPSDPYYQAALAYNTVATSDGILQNLVGGNVRIVLAPSPIMIPVDPYVPPNPIRILSFQPIP